MPKKNITNSTLKDLEDAVIDSYLKFNRNNNEKTSTAFFINVKKLAKAVLISNRWHRNKNVDIDMVAYEYSTSLFERIVIGKLSPETSDRFPWTKYINFSIRSFAYESAIDSSDVYFVLDADIERELIFSIDENTDNQVSRSLCFDPIYVQDKKQSDDSELIVNKRRFAKDLLNCLKMFYSFEDIKRLYPISIEYINNNNFNSLKENEIKDFCYVIICCAKKITSEYNKQKTVYKQFSSIEDVTKSAIRSSLFMAASTDSNILPKELLLSLDIDSLYRLCSIKGGENIRVPLLTELDTLIGAVIVASKKLAENSTSGCKSEFKDLDLVFKRRLNFNELVDSIVYSSVNLKDDSSVSLLTSLSSSIERLESFVSNIDKDINYLDCKDKITYYLELNKSLSMLSNSLINIINSINLKFPQNI